MDDSKVWHLHGARYDLTPFLDSHPGGKSILIATRGLRDASPLFESYHAFANREYIRDKLEQYRIEGPGLEPLYKYDGFYETLTQRARALFGASSEGVSVTSKVKASKWWWMKIICESILMVAMWIATFVLPPFDSPLARLSVGLITGGIFISLGFNTMHDASHFAIMPRNHWANQLFLRAWTAWALWSGSYWMTHHVVRHHAFTGHPELDPDTQHARPFIRKSLESPRNKYLNFPRVIKEVWQYAVLTTSVFALLPGMFVGQILSYSLIWPLRRHLWKMPHPGKGSFDRFYWETALSALSLLSHIMFSPSVYASTGFFVGCNIAYSICILPDHDTFEAAVDNHVEASRSSGEALPDWGEIQVRHSSDFGVGIWGRAFGEVAGGINFQIAHHLFPGVSHVHFPQLTKVVEETCEEFGIPFVRHSSLASALWSVAKTFSITMQPSKKSSADDDDSNAVVHVMERKSKARHCIEGHSRKFDAVTGLLFGGWLALGTLAVHRYGFHLLIVPAALLLSLGFSLCFGVLSPKTKEESFRDTRKRRLINLRWASSFPNGLLAASSIALIALELTASASSQLVCLAEMGIIAAELFALVLGSTFKVSLKRVVNDTMKLVLFTVLVLRLGEDFFPLLLLIIDQTIGLMWSSQSVSVQAAHIGLGIASVYSMAALLGLPMSLVATGVLVASSV